MQFRRVCLFAENRGLAMMNLTFQVFEAEMVGLIGLNDAGKSSFIDLMLGQAEATGGEIVLEGADYRPKSIEQANRRGVYHISRHSKLIDALSPEDNLTVIKGDIAGWRLTRRAESLQKLRELLEETGLTEMCARDVAQLTNVEKYLLEILKAMLNVAKLLLLSDILDIFDHEEDYLRLCALLERLHERGIAVVNISNRFHKILQYADRTFIFSQGRLVKTLYREEINRGTLERCLIAPENLSRMDYKPRLAGNGSELLRIEKLELGDCVCEPIPVFDREVLGIYDDGAFSERLCRELFSEGPKTARLYVEGKQVRYGKYWELFECRVGLFPQYYNNMYYCNMTA